MSLQDTAAALDRIPASPSSSRVPSSYPALNEQQRAIASAALADLGTGSSGTSDGELDGQFAQGAAPESSIGSQESWRTDDSLRRQIAAPVAQQQTRPYTPDRQIVGGNMVLASPRLEESSQLRQGAKRTASGAVKGMSNGGIMADLGQNGMARGHTRTKSSVRAIEISSQLKTRLAYAMVKVRLQSEAL
jgi:hypothetical protein